MFQMMAELGNISKQIILMYMVTLNATIRHYCTQKSQVQVPAQMEKV